MSPSTPFHTAQFRQLKQIHLFLASNGFLRHPESFFLGSYGRSLLERASLRPNACLCLLSLMKSSKNTANWRKRTHSRTRKKPAIAFRTRFLGLVGNWSHVSHKNLLKLLPLQNQNHSVPSVADREWFIRPPCSRIVANPITQILKIAPKCFRKRRGSSYGCLPTITAIYKRKMFRKMRSSIIFVRFLQICSKTTPRIEESRSGRDLCTWRVAIAGTVPDRPEVLSCAKPDSLEHLRSK